MAEVRTPSQSSRFSGAPPGGGAPAARRLVMGWRRGFMRVTAGVVPAAERGREGCELALGGERVGGTGSEGGGGPGATGERRVRVLPPGWSGSPGPPRPAGHALRHRSRGAPP